MKPKQLTMNIEAETDVCVNGSDLMTTDVQIKVTGHRDKNCKITLKAVSITEPIKLELPELGLTGSNAYTTWEAGLRSVVWENKGVDQYDNDGEWTGTVVPPCPLSESFQEILLDALYEQYEMEDEENA